MHSTRPDGAPQVLMVPAADARAEAPDSGAPAAPSLGAALIARPGIIAAVTLVFALGAAALLPVLKPIYRAEALVAIANDADGGLKGIGSGQVGALASLAGVDLGGDTKKGEYLARLRSKETVRQLIRESNLLPTLYRERWDGRSSRWTTSLLHPREPSMDDGVRRFVEKCLAVSEDRKSGLVTVSVSWSDPVLAAKWANRLIDIANANLRATAIEENSRRTEFLQRELERTTAVETRQVIFRLLEQHLNRIMVANTQPQYALRTVDPAETPDPYRPESPRLGKLLGYGAMLGACIGALISLMLTWRRSMHVSSTAGRG